MHGFLSLSYAALVRRNFAADLFAEKYDNQSQSKGNQSNSIEHNRTQSKGNRTQSNFPKFSIFDWHSIDLINISIVSIYVRLFSINSIIEIFD